jgi:hypothetical protein
VVWRSSKDAELPSGIAHFNWDLVYQREHSRTSGVAEKITLPDGRVAERVEWDTETMYGDPVPRQLGARGGSGIGGVQAGLVWTALFILTCLGFSTLGGSVFIWWIGFFIAGLGLTR